MSEIRHLSVSVRSLVDFVLRSGDLGGDRDFVAPSRALEGTRGHQRVQRSRPDGYEMEVALSQWMETPEFTLTIKGRIDGIQPTARPVLIEEIKTVVEPWNGVPETLHWAQAKIYAAIYAQQNDLEAVEVHLTYLELETDRQHTFRDTFSRADLAQFFDQVVGQYLAWTKQQVQWLNLRDQSIAAVAFPYSAYRVGQRELAVAVYRTLARRGKLYVEAPTGIGKTISTVFPAIKAMGQQAWEKLFYLTAKTVGRTVAELAFADLQRAGLHFRTVTLTAKEKICINQGQPCEAITCPFAKGYYDRIKPAIQAALQQETITRSVVEAVAAQHQVCPFELSLDIALWTDGIICDYNYVFDPKVYLKRFFADNEGEYIFLIDEAHNLVERARDMFSAELCKADLMTVKRAIQKALPNCAKALNRISRHWNALIKSELAVENAADADDTAASGESFAPMDAASSTGTLINQLTLSSAIFADSGAVLHSSSTVRSLKSNPPAAAQSDPSPFAQADEPGFVKKELPDSLLPLLGQFLEEAEVWLVQNQPADFREILLELYFQIFGFLRTADLYDERYVTIYEGSARQARLRLFCLDPSFLLQKALQRGKSAVFFSATLTPIDYFRQILGGDSHDAVLRLSSPFPPEHLCLLIQDRISTHWKSRASTYDAIAHAIAAVVQVKQGNYLVYFPSYLYMSQVLGRFHQLYPAVTILVQSTNMSETQRETFLAAFRADHQQTLVGFAVLGGVFGEGIDLVGERLIGAIVVGVGLPQLSLERDLIRDYFQSQQRDGFDYAYTFPGMNRVLQAVGRVIRSEQDRGVVLLIDTRFARARYRHLFPSWWQPQIVRNAQQITARLQQFWQHSKT